MVKLGWLLLGGITATLIVAAGWAYTPDKSRIALGKKYDDNATRYLDIDGSQVRVRDSGEKRAPAIIFLHGFGSSLETWEPWADALSDRYRVVRLDLPGCGLSESDRADDYTDARSISVIRQLMDQLKIDKAVLVGNSMGGRIAWRMAAAFPDRVSKLVLISPDGFKSPGFDYGKPAQVPAVLQLMKYFLPEALVRPNLAAAYADPAKLNDATVDRYYDLLLATGNRAAMIARMQQIVLEDPVPILKRINTPTLLLWGKRDRMIPYTNSSDYIQALPHVRLVSFPDLGHVPHEEAPVESLGPLRPFLAESP
jgi:pimeloyl-ACP methyl ester carboxylesterase